MVHAHPMAVSLGEAAQEEQLCHRLIIGKIVCACGYSSVIFINYYREYCELIDLTCESNASSEGEPGDDDVQVPTAVTDLK